MKKLAQIFKNKCHTGAVDRGALDYYWFLDEENNPIGISKDISKTEHELIESNYVSLGIQDITDVEKLLWRGFLTNKTSATIPSKSSATTHAKFVFFFHDFDADLQFEFESLVQSFDANFKVFFLDFQYGFILDLTIQTRHDVEIEDFLLAAKEDFSALIFYQTIRYDINPWLPGKFQSELTLFKEFKNGTRAIMTYKDIFLSYLVSSEVVSQYPIFGDWFSQIFLIDAELLAVVKCYLENGFNVTTGAKLMHMHRNTFMNKLDLFAQMTGLDVRQIDAAVIAYLLMRLRKDVQI